MKRIPIATIRREIAACNYVRRSLTGCTAEEYRRQNLPLVLNEHIATLRELAAHIPAKKTDDAQDLANAIERSNAEIARWHAAHVIHAAKQGAFSA